MVVEGRVLPSAAQHGGKNVAKVKAVSGGKGGPSNRFKGVRLCMKNGSVFTFNFIESRYETERKVTKYFGLDGLYLGEVRDEEVVGVMSADVPFIWKKRPASNAPGAPMVEVQHFEKGFMLVAGYNPDFFKI